MKAQNNIMPKPGANTTYEEHRLFWHTLMHHEWNVSRIPAEGNIEHGREDSLHEVAYALPQGLSDKVLRIAGGTEKNIYAILLSAVCCLLRKYLGTSHLVTGTPLSDHVMPVCLDWQEQFTFKDIIMQVKAVVKDCIAHQHYPVNLLIEELGKEDTQHSAFPVVVVFEDLQPLEKALDANPEIIFAFRKEGGSLILKMLYRPALFSKQRIDVMSENLQYLFAACLEQPEAPVKYFELQDLSALAAVMPETGNLRGYDAIIDVFEEQVRLRPDNIAITFRGENISYAELNRRANILANNIKDSVPGNDCIIGILLERSVDMIVTIIGIMKTGACYLPLDPSHPAERINYILRDSACNMVITNNRGKETLEGVAVYNIEDAPVNIDETEIKRKTQRSDLLYIIYTSGTTGKPKGALIENGNLLSLLFCDHQPFDFGPADTWILFHSYCFDFSVWEMYGALLFGGKLVIMSDTDVRSPDMLIKVLVDHQVTVLNQTPSAFYNLIFEIGKSSLPLPSLRMVIFGGEALSPGKLSGWRKSWPHVKLINMFGITETTIHVTFKEIGEYEIAHNISNVGKPLPHLSIRLLNNDGNVLPPGFTGEIAVSGHGVCRGYLNKPALTSARFRSNESGRTYFSGDLGWIDNRGDLVYLGRKDSQVQLRGYRIELGEIEAAMLKFPGIANSVVICKTVSEEEKFICAYYVAERKTDHKELRLFLNRLLPVYMVPSYFLFLEKLPLNHNGKIDMARLPDIGTQDMQQVDVSKNIDPVMMEIWQHNLGLTSFPANENYFTIGGDSMRALKLLNLVNQQYNIKLSLKDIYKHNTLIALSDFVHHSYNAADDSLRATVEQELCHLRETVLAGEPAMPEIADVYPMADIQKGMVFYSGMDTGEPLYHDQMLHTLHYPGFDFQAFSEALTIITERHPILRTVFNVNDYGEPLQIVYKTVKPDIALTDLSTYERTQQRAFIKEAVQADRQRPMDLRSAPTWRVKVFLLNNDHITLMLVFHHAIIDGWSDATFKTELHNIYQRIKKGSFQPLPALQTSYRQFVIEEMMHSRNTRLKEFWKNELAGAGRLTIAGEGTVQQKRTLGSHRIVFPEQMMADIRRRCTAEKISVKNFFFTAFSLVISAAGKSNSFVTGYCTHNRPVGPDGDKVLGCFLNVIPVRTEIPAGILWIEMATILEKKLLKLKEQDGLSLVGILDAADRSTTGSNPLFDVLFNYVDFYVYDNMETTVEVLQDTADNEGYTNTNTLLDFNVSSTQGLTELIINYAANVLDENKVRVMAHYFRHIVEGMPGTSSVRTKNVFSRHELLSPDAEVLPEDILSFTDTHHIEKEVVLLTAYAVLHYKHFYRKELTLGYRVTGHYSQPGVNELLKVFNGVLPVNISLDTAADFLSNCHTIAAGIRVYSDPDVSLSELTDALLAQTAFPGDSEPPELVIPDLPGQLTYLIAHYNTAIDDLTGNQNSVFTSKDIMKAFNF